MSKLLLARVWRKAKFFMLVIVASLLGVMLAGYPDLPRDSFLGSLVAGQAAYQRAKLALHKHWRPYHPLRIKKQHIEGERPPARTE